MLAYQPPPVGSVINGKYELTRFVGKGGMGAVYEALTPEGERVALKLLLRADNAKAAARFTREAKVVDSLSHPNIVPLLDAGVEEENETAYMVMPLLVGMDLRRVLKRLAPLHPVVAVRIVRQACLALESAHKSGVIHRDIKPANLYLHQQNGEEVTVKMLDFGIAKWAAEDTALTKTGMLLGTPHYASPEQLADSRDVDVRSDVWSLAVVLYRALSGRVPFREKKTAADLCLAIIGTDVPLIQDSAPWVDPSLATIVHGALMRDRLLRCPTAREFANALEPFADGSDELKAGMLETVPKEMRETATQRINRPRAWKPVRPSVAPPPMPKAVHDPMLGATLSERYTLLRKLGKGGMATVYEATTPGGDRCAVKVMSPEVAETPEAQRRFVREARALNGIASPHVVKVLEAGQDSAMGLPYIAMELLHGEDLQIHLKRTGALAPRAMASLFSQACAGLQAAHELGLVHRDIKPANLFLHQLPSDELVVKVCDFGLVKRFLADEDAETTAHLTQIGGVIGSPMYMSPEQAKHSSLLDQRSDVWSLGVTLFHCLTGKLPWRHSNSIGELLVAICTQEVPNLQDEAPWVPPELARAVHKSLRREPDERFQTMAEFAAALSACAPAGTPVTIRQLTAVSTVERRVMAPRAVYDTAETELGSVAAPRSDALPPKRGRGALAVGAVAIAAAAGIALLFGARSEPAANASAASQQAPQLAAAARSSEPRDVAVAVKPITATVLVDGAETVLDNGFIRMLGEPGDRFVITLIDGDNKLEKAVFITKEGLPIPAELELKAPPAKASAEPPKPRARRRPATRRPTSRKPATPKPEVVAAPPPKPRPRPKPPSIARDDW